MSEHKRTLAVFPGAFDPITNGHVDVLRRGAGLFDELVVAVGENPAKTPLLPLDRRAEIVREVVAGLPNVRVETYTGLTVTMAARLGACAILRGLRGSSDLPFERSVALTNRQISGIETVFVLPAAEHSFISSTLVRQIAQGGGDVSALVPPEALPCLRDLRRPAE
jgi:pantetheine-phosphate adenylyltransferase